MVVLRRLAIQGVSTVRKMSTRQLDVTRPEIASILCKDVQWLCEIFTKKGFEIRVVGGAVRDLLLGHAAKDIDLSTTATPPEMIGVFQENSVRYIETGLQHGTLTAHINDNDFEVTTLRVDVETDGRHAVVEFTNDWRLDAERRDLTFNALSMDVNGVLYDYFNGEQDLIERKVRFVGDAEQRIREDYLRILRYFRFYGKIAEDTCRHENITLDVIKRLAPGMAYLAVERVWTEVSKIVVGNFAPHLVRLMYEMDVNKVIGFPLFNKAHMEVFEGVWSHNRNVKLSPITPLVSMIKDVEEAESFCTRWKLSNAERNLACFIVTNRYDESNIPSTLKPFKDLLVTHVDVKNQEKAREHIRQLMFYHHLSDMSTELDQWTVPRFPVTGGDLKKAGIKPGPQFGKILAKLKKAWIESDFSLTQENLLKQI